MDSGFRVSSASVRLDSFFLLLPFSCLFYFCCFFLKVCAGYLLGAGTVIFLTLLHSYTLTHLDCVCLSPSPSLRYNNLPSLYTGTTYHNALTPTLTRLNLYTCRTQYYLHVSQPVLQSCILATAENTTHHYTKTKEKVDFCHGSI